MHKIVPKKAQTLHDGDTSLQAKTLPRISKPKKVHNY
jgi:hypothetical protein